MPQRACRGRPAGHCRRQARPFGEAARRHRRRGKRLIDGGEGQGRARRRAPDTFLGGAHQTCRKLIDAGAIGEPLAGTAFFCRPGMSAGIRIPAFYYLAGGGPMLDMGPYYITALVNLLGPVARVAGITSRARRSGIITSEPLKGTLIPVEVATHAAGTLEFVSGALVTIGPELRRRPPSPRADRDLRLDRRA